MESGAPITLAEVSTAMDRLVRTKGWYATTSPRPQTPRNLATSIGTEVGELLECFQWVEKPEDMAVADELADIVLYAAQLANVMGLDLDQAVRTKIARNTLRSWDGEAGAAAV